MARRKDGQGTVYRRSDGRWEAQPIASQGLAWIVSARPMCRVQSSAIGGRGRSRPALASQQRYWSIACKGILSAIWCGFRSAQALPRLFNSRRGKT